MPYTVEWTETAEHKREFSDAEMAALKGVTVEELAEMDEDDISEDLDDLLAEVGEDDGFEGLEREIDVFIKH